MRFAIGLLPLLLGSVNATAFADTGTSTASASLDGSSASKAAASTTASSTTAASTTAAGTTAATTTAVAESGEKQEGGLVARFKGSVLYAQTGMNLNILDPGIQQTKDPTVETYLLLSPRFRVNDWLQLRGRFTATYEWTNSDVTTFDHEFVVGDGAFQAFYTGLPAFLDGTKATLGLSVTLPFSKISQAQTMYFSPAAIAEVGHEFKGVLGGSVAVKGIGSYAHPLFDKRTPSLDFNMPYSRTCFGGAGDCVEQGSGKANVSDTLSWSLAVAGTWGPVETTLLFNMVHQFPYTFSDIDGVDRDPSRTSLRNSTYVSLSVGTELTDWASAEVSYSMFRNLLDEDGTRGNPFFARYQDMRLGVGFSFALEQVYSAVTR